MSTETHIERFESKVLSQYRMYNSIFTTLPFEKVKDTGILLPLFHLICVRGFEEENKNPSQIVAYFFKRYMRDTSEQEKRDLLLDFIRYIERQVVLFDATEDANFSQVNNMNGVGTLRYLRERLSRQHQEEDLKDFLDNFKIRLVLTAHPTQFYPPTVLGIMTDLQKSIKKRDLASIKMLLAQLGRTPFFAKEKPSPYDEAVGLIWYLENVFYKSIAAIVDDVRHHIYGGDLPKNDFINLGFWPGGDRDGNPFVTTDTTLKVARKLRSKLIKCYYNDMRALRRRLTFDGVYKKVRKLERKLYASFTKGETLMPLNDFKAALFEIRDMLNERYSGFFAEKVESIISKVAIFGYHFASLDIRQDSRVHHDVFVEIVKALHASGSDLFPTNYLELNEDAQIEVLSHIKAAVDPELFSDEMVVNTLSSIKAIQTIQSENGEKGCNRYIISNNQKAINVMETFAMLNLCGFEGDVPVDVMPLFETVDDLNVCQDVMRTLYTNEAYRTHLKARGDKQSIMLGFSDGTKDGGYLMANWSIFKAKERLTAVSREFGIKVVFFDGRGGPPARGGGKTHQFYASLGDAIENKEIQLTVQGQTISSNFGNLDSSRYNIEQLIGAGVANALLKDAKNSTISQENRALFDELANISYQVYSDFKSHPMFIPYLERMSTLKYYGKANIGSRPSKRNSSSELKFSDLRAIPFVGSWSQLKQNVPGFFGVGTAFKAFEDKGEFDKIVKLYKECNFFKTLLENSVMSMTKSFFKLTSYMSKNEEFGAFWNLIYEEYQLTKKMLCKLTGHQTLMQNDLAGRASIEARESIALPLLTIQQYALREIHERNDEACPDAEQLAYFERVVTRSLFGNINASRNSA